MLLKALAEDLLPETAVVFRGPQGRTRALSSLRRTLLGQKNGGKPGRVALTFDDGPTPLTPRLLELLAQLDVRTTFFLIGEKCAEQPELVQAIAAAGHELASHGYTHRRFTSLSWRELESELARTRALLPEHGRRRPLVRPPYGSVSVASLLACARHGFTTVLWSVNSCDWRLQDADEVAKVTLQQTADPDEIVLFHEGQAWTLDALPAIVAGLKQAGHELVTVGELLA
jgi:peptidoglycan/xylan/chitin deacetylase (PgdA/CDA1 family)